MATKTTGLPHDMDCVCCNDRRSAASVKHQCGTRIEKHFAHSENNTQAGWYAGRIVSHFYAPEDGKLVNFIRYEDGDEETMDDTALAEPSVRIMGDANKKARSSVTAVSPDSATSCCKALSNSNVDEIGDSEADQKPPIAVASSGAVSSDDSTKVYKQEVEVINVDDGEDAKKPPIAVPSSVSSDDSTKSCKQKVEVIEIDDSYDELASPDSSRTRAHIPEQATAAFKEEGIKADAAVLEQDNEIFPENLVSSYSTAVAPAPDGTMSSGANNEVPAPDGPISSTVAIRTEVLSTVNEDVKVKKEGSAAKLSPEERQKREACFDKWKAANTDPKTGEGRYVFRRGCHEHSITKVLGGSGMEPWPVVKNPPIISDDSDANPFIKSGEYYVAGNEDWNPFGPRFPGDSGCVNCHAFGGVEDQEDFHLFVECSRTPLKRHWHGKLAAGGRMYVGVYRRIHDEDGIDSTLFRFVNDFATDSQTSIAEFFVRWEYRDNDGRLRPGLEERHTKAAMQLADASDIKWDPLSQHAKHTWIMVAYLIDTDYTMEVEPVEYVRFDEELYQCLVSKDCAVSRRKVRGRVELEADILQQYY